MNTTWIFDLDDTLHYAKKKIFPLINQRMNQYIQSHLKINKVDANRLRQQYWDQFGATLKGLIENYQIDPNHFLKTTHQIRNIKQIIEPVSHLKKILQTIKGKKILYTNAPKSYASNIIKLCNVDYYFDNIFSIENSKFQPKPSLNGMKMLLAKYKIKKAIYIDDKKENLKTAHQLGLKTIWLNHENKKLRYIDRRIVNLNDLLKHPYCN